MESSENSLILTFADIQNASKSFDERISLVELVNEEVRIDSIIEIIYGLQNRYIKKLWVYPVLYTTFLMTKFSHDNFLIPEKIEQLLLELDEIEFHSPDFQRFMLKITLNLPIVLEPVLKWITNLQLKEIKKISLFGEILNNIKCINDFFDSKFIVFNDLELIEKKDLLFQFRYATACQYVFSLLLNKTCVNFLQNVSLNDPDSEIIDYLIYILPSILRRIEISIDLILEFVEKMNEDQFMCFLRELMVNSINETILFRLILFGIDFFNNTKWIDDTCINLQVSQYLKVDISHYFEFYDKILHSHKVIPTTDIFSVIDNFSSSQKELFKIKLVEWLKERDSFVNHVIPRITVILYQNQLYSFLDEWKKWYIITDERTWLKILAKYIKNLYISPDEINERHRTQEEENFLTQVLEELETVTRSKNLDINQIYGGSNREIFGKIFMLSMFLKLTISMPFNRDRILENLDKYPIFVQLMGRDWFERNIMENSVTHFVFFLMSVEKHYYLEYAESVVNQIIINLDPSNINSFQERLRNSSEFFDTIVELSFLSIFLPYGVVLKEMAYRLPNRKDIDFLLEKDNQKVLLEVYNVRPWGPLEHLPDVWLLPNLVKDAIINKYKRKKIQNIIESDLEGIPLLFGLDLSQSGADIDDIDTAMLGTEAYKRIEGKNGFQYIPVRQVDSIFHSRHVTDLVSGFIWIKQVHREKNSLLITSAYLKENQIPKWFKEVIDLNINKFR